MRRVKIIATLGPASQDIKVIEELARAGADVFRINMSHASHDLLKQTVVSIREVERTLNHPLGVLVDLQGPKLRVGTFEGGSAQLVAGEAFTLDGNPVPGDKTRVFLPHPEIIDSVGVGDRLLLDDGKLQLRATRVGGGAIEATVI
jgi:pyruvate kinase